MINTSHIEIHMQLVNKIQSLKEEYEKEIEYVKSLFGKCSKEIYEIEYSRMQTLRRVIKDLEELLK